MNEKQLTNHMAAILESPDTQRIQFTFVGKSGLEIPVMGARFTRVARALRGGTIKVSYPATTGAFAAFYHAGLNTMSVSARAPLSSRLFNALVVHESLHAAFDLNKSVLTLFESEAAAFIAQGCYLKNSGYGGKIAAVTKEDGPVFIGFEAARQITPGNRVVKFDDAWVEELRMDLELRRGYAGRLDNEVKGDH